MTTMKAILDRILKSSFIECLIIGFFWVLYKAEQALEFCKVMWFCLSSYDLMRSLYERHTNQQEQLQSVIDYMDLTVGSNEKRVEAKYKAYLSQSSTELPDSRPDRLWKGPPTFTLQNGLSLDEMRKRTEKEEAEMFKGV